jgi:uncharacterized glyoxalase superfamily protein PhnB
VRGENELHHSRSLSNIPASPRRAATRWAQNTMLQLMVDDLDAWWSHITSLDLPANFAVPAPKPPAMQPWGLRVAYLTDPAGVLWHVAQRRPDARQD